MAGVWLSQKGRTVGQGGRHVGLPSKNHQAYRFFIHYRASYYCLDPISPSFVCDARDTGGKHRKHHDCINWLHLPETQSYRALRELDKTSLILELDLALWVLEEWILACPPNEPLEAIVSLTQETLQDIQAIIEAWSFNSTALSEQQSSKPWTTFCTSE